MASMPKGHFEAISHEKDLWVRAVPVEDQPEGDDKGQGSVHPIRRTAPASPSSGVAAKIREWAAGQGIEVAKHGRLPQDLIDQYDEAHP